VGRAGDLTEERRGLIRAALASIAEEVRDGEPEKLAALF